MNELWIIFDEKTHEPIYMAMKEPNCKNCEFKDAMCSRQSPDKCEKGYPFRHLAGDPKAAFKPVETKDCDTCEIYLAGKCDQIAYDEKTDTSLCPFDKEEKEK